ncbi:MAG: hypothetical protein ACR2F2_11455 [Pyrinomonadaceae bacterium]
MEDEIVSYTKKDIIKVLAYLEMMVVSLDRIGSEYGEWEDRKSEEELNSLLADFIFEWRVTGRLAKARMILSSAFSSELGEDDMDELEREFKDLQYWSMKNPKSIKKQNSKK